MMFAGEPIVTVVPETLIAIARASKRSLQNRNAAPIIATVEPAYLKRNSSRYNINLG